MGGERIPLSPISDGSSREIRDNHSSQRVFHLRNSVPGQEISLFAHSPIRGMKSQPVPPSFLLCPLTMRPQTGRMLESGGVRAQINAQSSVSEQPQHPGIPFPPHGPDFEFETLKNEHFPPQNPVSSRNLLPWFSPGALSPSLLGKKEWETLTPDFSQLRFPPNPKFPTFPDGNPPSPGSCLSQNDSHPPGAQPGPNNHTPPCN